MFEVMHPVLLCHAQIYNLDKLTLRNLFVNFHDLVKSAKTTLVVIPAQAGILPFQ